MLFFHMLQVIHFQLQLMFSVFTFFPQFSQSLLKITF